MLRPLTVYGFLKVVMYAGVAMGLIGFAYPIDDAKLGLSLPYRANDILSYGGLALVVIGYVGRLVTKPEESSTGTWQ